MSMRRDDFAMDIYYDNKQYTPQQVADYITNTSGARYADSEKIKALIEESRETLKSTMEKYSITMEQMLQTETSPAGKELAGLVLNHGSKTMDLIQKGGANQGVMI